MNQGVISLIPSCRAYNIPEKYLREIEKKCHQMARSRFSLSYFGKKWSSQAPVQSFHIKLANKCICFVWHLKYSCYRKIYHCACHHSLRIINLSITIPDDIAWLLSSSTSRQRKCARIFELVKEHDVPAKFLPDLLASIHTFILTMKNIRIPELALSSNFWGRRRSRRRTRCRSCIRRRTRQSWRGRRRTL